MNLTTLFEAGRFVRSRFPPLKHTVYCMIWTSSCLAQSKLLTESRNSFEMSTGYFSARHLWAFVLSFLILLFMRVVDDWKDLPYDRMFNPHRALPARTVSLKTCKFMLAGVASTVALLGFWTPQGSTSIAFTILIYSLMLLLLDQKSQWFSEKMYLNLGFSVQLKTLGNLLILNCFLGPENLLPALPLAFASTFSYLAWETSRKTVPCAELAPSLKAYSRESGYWGSLVIAFCFATLSASVFWIENANPLVWAVLGLFGFALGIHKKIKKINLGAVGLFCYLLFLIVPLFWEVLCSR